MFSLHGGFQASLGNRSRASYITSVCAAAEKAPQSTKTVKITDGSSSGNLFIVLPGQGGVTVALSAGRGDEGVVEVFF